MCACGWRNSFSGSPRVERRFELKIARSAATLRCARAGTLQMSHFFAINQSLKSFLMIERRRVSMEFETLGARVVRNERGHGTLYVTKLLMKNWISGIRRGRKIVRTYRDNFHVRFFRSRNFGYGSACGNRVIRDRKAFCGIFTEKKLWVLSSSCSGWWTKV